MHRFNRLEWLVCIIVLCLCKFSKADEAKPHQFLDSVYQWRSEGGNLKLGGPVVVAGVLCFMAATISSAGGIGGGGLYIPILTIVAGLELKTASSFSAFMVTGGIIANVVCSMFMPSSKHGGRVLVDFDIALLSEPFMLLGVSFGVICNVVFPEWLITVLFAVFLVWCTFSTFRSGILYWKLETRNDGCSEMETGMLDKQNCRETEGAVSAAEQASLRGEIAWMKLGMLLMIWLCFFLLYLFRGNQSGHGIVDMEACGVGYWIISSIQIPLAVSFTAWILFSKERCQSGEEEEETRGLPNKFIFPVMALLAGFLGGVFGIGGGMLISPLLIQVGLPPQITAATCSFMVLFSSTMSAVQYLLLGMEHTESAMIFAGICLAASLLGLVVVQRAIEKHGRASLIVFSVGTVMALSTVLITSFGAVDAWKDYESGRYMGFKPPC
nr:sulfite exporter TauE/SafE family protein 2-like [Ipomoea batatas]